MDFVEPAPQGITYLVGVGSATCVPCGVYQPDYGESNQPPPNSKLTPAEVDSQSESGSCGGGGGDAAAEDERSDPFTMPQYLTVRGAGNSLVDGRYVIDLGDRMGTVCVWVGVCGWVGGSHPLNESTISYRWKGASLSFPTGVLFNAYGMRVHQSIGLTTISAYRCLATAGRTDPSTQSATAKN